MKKLIMASITAVVVIAVLAGTLIPILDDATATHETFTNSGYYRMSYAGTDKDVTIEWDYTAPHQVTVNNEVVTLPDTDIPLAALTLTSGDNWLVRYNGNSFVVYLNASSNRIASVANETSATLTLTGGAVSFSNTAGDTWSSTYTGVYYPSNDGDYVMKLSDEPAYMNGDSDFYAHGRTYIVGGSKMFIVSGSIEDGATVTDVYTSGASITDVTVDYTQDNDYIDLYKLNKITFNVTNPDTEATELATYSYFIVPYQVTAEKAVHFTDGENAIFNAIPVMIIIALLLGVVALVLRSRMD